MGNILFRSATEEVENDPIYGRVLTTTNGSATSRSWILSDEDQEIWESFDSKTKDELTNLALRVNDVFPVYTLARVAFESKNIDGLKDVEGLHKWFAGYLAYHQNSEYTSAERAWNPCNDENCRLYSTF